MSLLADDPLNKMQDQVGQTCMDHLLTFPRGCLPDIAKEWTVYTAICEEIPGQDISVVAAGTGTKCFSRSQLSPTGGLLHDSHAEIIAIRSFKRYLMIELEAIMRGTKSRLFEGSLEDGYRLKPDIKYHLFTTHPPCGDATIFPVEVEHTAGEPPPSKKVKIVGDSTFTGAKLIDQSDQFNDVLAQDEGAVRTKPGRGERTLSMSCSDKLAKCLVMGFQGFFLSTFLRSPIYMHSFVLCSNSGYNRNSLERALYRRFDSKSILAKEIPFSLTIPEILESTIEFPFSKDSNKSPCPKTIIYCKVPEKSIEISVDGRRQGVAKKNISNPSSRLKICRVEMLKQYQQLLLLYYPNLDEDSLKATTYKEIKLKYCTEYLFTWDHLKKNYFKTWSEKPSDLKDFVL